MIEQIISLETAKLAKEKKFREEVFSYYNCNKTGIYGEFVFNSFDYLEQDQDDWNGDGSLTTISAPTQSLLQKWLREIHGIHIILIPTITSSWTYKTITVISKRDNEVILGIKSVSDLPPYKEVCGYDFSTYEEALEVGLLTGLKLIKI